MCPTNKTDEASMMFRCESQPEMEESEWIASAAGLVRELIRADFPIASAVLPLPPTENHRLMPVRMGSKLRLIKSTEYRGYIERARMEMHNHPDAPWTVTKGHWCILVMRSYFPNRRWDAGNSKKSVEDALFAQDRDVCTWVLPPGVDKKRPRVEVWATEIKKEES